MIVVLRAMSKKGKKKPTIKRRLAKKRCRRDMFWIFIFKNKKSFEKVVCVEKHRFMAVMVIWVVVMRNNGEMTVWEKK